VRSLSDVDTERVPGLPCGDMSPLLLPGLWSGGYINTTTVSALRIEKLSGTLARGVCRISATVDGVDTTQYATFVSAPTSRPFEESKEADMKWHMAFASLLPLVHLPVVECFGLHRMEGGAGGASGSRARGAKAAKTRFFVFYRLPYYERTKELLEDTAVDVTALSDSERDVLQRTVLLADLIGFSVTKKTFVWRETAKLQLGKQLCFVNPASKRHEDFGNRVRGLKAVYPDTRNDLLPRVTGVTTIEQLCVWKPKNDRFFLEVIRRIDERLLGDSNVIQERICSTLRFMCKS